ncbi:MAG: hypothetical protein VX260_01710 [Candidatus Neomarinimicrobiota bacterium]|nr:hypothetical protein [Candidatus Neomarinimicrobiota bacterium]
MIIISGCLENTVTADLNDPGMMHDTLSISSIMGFNYQTPPELGNSTLLYLGTDSSGFQNPFALFKVQSNSINTSETFDSFLDSTVEIDSAKFILTFNSDTIETGMIFDLYYFPNSGDSIFNESNSNYLNLIESELSSEYVSSGRLFQRLPDSTETIYPTLSFNVLNIIQTFIDSSNLNQNRTLMVKPKFDLSNTLSFKSSESGFAFAPQLHIFTHDTTYIDSTSESVSVDTFSHEFISTDDLSIIIPPTVSSVPGQLTLGRGLSYKGLIEISDLDSFLLPLPEQSIITKAELSFYYPIDTTQSNFYLQVQPVSDTIHYEQLQGVLLEDPIDVISNILPVVNISNNGKVILNIREYLQLIHFGYVSNYGLKLEVINTSNPFNLYSLYSHSSLIDSLNPELLVHYVSP